ncbi:response regulator transcription factor [Roseibium marinum]|uniref:Response regulator receiver domain-containing protein n=1 Tax=Roseibium marinum TaxID=281252 RepID=A0A2S3URY3_9HYPH|nr:response regulator [Roseibium marinum]POF30446.1 response regulator receiver domain-containing protein [Roseibium marinum]
MSKVARILCVEDEEMLLHDLKEELEDENYEVLTAKNGQVALEILETEKPDLIISDMMMPKLDGPGLLTHIRANRPGLNDVPVIFLTAKATRDDLIEGKRLGVDDYLTKPVDYDLLLATVEANLGQVLRIKKQNQIKLRRIYNAIQKQRATSEELRVSFIAQNPNSVQPILKALNELGCAVSVISEDQLVKRSFSLSTTDILFIVYSKVVHYYLKYVTDDIGKDWEGISVLLAPPKLSEEQRTCIKDAGISDTIEYPYPPIEVFKLLMRRMKA